MVKLEINKVNKKKIIAKYISDFCFGEIPF